MLKKIIFRVKGSQFSRNFLGVSGMYMFGIPLSLLINIVIARELGADEYGQYVFMVSVLTLLTIPVSGGLPQLLTREVSRFSHSSEWSLYQGIVKAAHIWVLLVSVVFIFIFYVIKASEVLPSQGKWTLLGILILMVPLHGLNSVRNGTIKGLGFPALAELPLQTIQPLLLLLGVGLLAFANMLTPASALWMQVAVTLLTLLIASWLFLRVRPVLSKKSIPVYRNPLWLKALIPFSLISLVGTFNSQIGIIMLGALGTNESAGILRIADRAAQFVSLALMIANMVIAPYIAKAYQSNDIEKLQNISRNSSRGAFAIAIVVAIIFIFFGKKIVYITFGVDYSEDAYLPMIILIAGQLFNVAMGSVGVLLAMSGHEKLTLLGQTIGLLSTSILAIILIPIFSEIGAAVAVTFGLVTWNIVMALLVYRNIKIYPGVL